MKHAPFMEITEESGTKHYVNILHIRQIVLFHDETTPRVCIDDSEYRTKESYQEILARLDYAYRED